MASASSQTASSSPPLKIKLPQSEHLVTGKDLALPGLLRCLIVSDCSHRTDLLRTAARNESWQVVVAKDAGEFLRHIFSLNVPLTIVDLPEPTSETYARLRETVSRSADVSSSLLVVCTPTKCATEELWARQLGAWTYLPEAEDLAGLELIFSEARKAIAQQSTAYVETTAYR